ncbi:hypothetical protein Tco_1315573 [Tanacetum coccineum]
MEGHVELPLYAHLSWGSISSLLRQLSQLLAIHPDTGPTYLGFQLYSLFQIVRPLSQAWPHLLVKDDLFSCLLELIPDPSARTFMLEEITVVVDENSGQEQLEVNLPSRSQDNEAGIPCQLILSVQYNLANLSNEIISLIGKMDGSSIFDYVDIAAECNGSDNVFHSKSLGNSSSNSADCLLLSSALIDDYVVSSSIDHNKPTKAFASIQGSNARIGAI